MNKPRQLNSTASVSKSHYVMMTTTQFESRLQHEIKSTLPWR